MRVKLVRYTEDGEKLVAVASKRSLSRKSLEEQWLKIKDEEVETWIRETFRRGHFSPWEHSVYTFSVEGCSRVCTHQLVRHRLASYTQLSQRYSDNVLRFMALKSAEVAELKCGKREWRCYAKALREVVSTDEQRLKGLAMLAYVFPPRLSEKKKTSLARSYLEATAEYYELLSKGVPAEDARYILPQAVKSSIVVTLNARELLHVISLRGCTRAQWEIRSMAWLMWREAFKVHPRLFKWAGPRCLFHENLVREEPLSLDNFLGVSFSKLLELKVDAQAASPKIKLVSERCPEGVPRNGIHPCVIAGIREAFKYV